METGNHLEPDEGWGEAGVNGAEWARLHALLEVVRREHQRTELSSERREQIRARVLERLDRIEARRRRVRAIMAGVAGVLVAGLVLAVVVRARHVRPGRLAALR